MTEAFIRVSDFKIRPDYHMHVWFSDGSAGLVDCRPLLSEELFRGLRDETVFAKALLTSGGDIIWPGGVDIATSWLYRKAHGDNPFAELDVCLRRVRELAEEGQDYSKADECRAECFKHHSNPQLATLHKYIAELGGELILLAKFDDKTVRIRGITQYK